MGDDTQENTPNTPEDPEDQPIKRALKFIAHEFEPLSIDVQMNALLLLAGMLASIAVEVLPDSARDLVLVTFARKLLTVPRLNFPPDEEPQPSNDH